jgi:hypothetical protein
MMILAFGSFGLDIDRGFISLTLLAGCNGFSRTTLSIPLRLTVLRPRTTSVKNG